MNLNQKGAEDLLKLSFQSGMAGILFGLTPLVVKALLQPTIAYAGWFAGLAIGLQLLGLSLAVLVLRRKKISAPQKEKAKKMTLILAVSLLFFMLV
ncbi:hypothetical protein [Cyclobacterium marinum]|uniref:Uncharacterized protein n=1 Tax=Cyclobacterium marinum (strain ATCC 25205 / DSM 745 / LMG 13164 / NCIMB 1802) TaxID=880070 RepID=G0J1B4_CYCMS|nr:hypothetical protein [Cyclobacterium marinum]AEL26553.1 hypothetical protein Cycma_2815 [Cyclobacterium marinum DSM 745]